ncbi:MAG: MBL fold metallo-hydrolase [Deltaproteobacteria bacterium]|uniref:MBL fold metallo-hydrolase n=1 Tax=Candidatus Desulfacyla euxinica TaxID=2841693 RepID=A0A8J6N468_9DELT|nr:MBL fold metallo-hydrolase [Candidatus Desulfacyla euxinica]MBL7218322.1 MBL fold metallo-hydrolase [Desulfobacteraceae bacterium]
MKVKFWGTRGSIAAPGKDTIFYGGNTCCVEIDLECGKKVIIDTGTGIRPLGDRMIAQEEKVEIHLLLTHAHWDHLQGFPFFDPIFNPDTKIHVDGARACIKGLRAIFENNVGDIFFPVRFGELKAQISYIDKLCHGPLKIEDVIIDAIPLHHPQGGLGFRFQEGDKRLIFITDNELTEDAPAGRRPEDYVRFCRDADVLIHDSQFTPDEIPNHKGWGHSDYATTLDLALKAHAKRLVLFHHAPFRKDSEVTAIKAHCEDLAAKNRTDIMIDAAKEGSEFTL